MLATVAMVIVGLWMGCSGGGHQQASAVDVILYTAACNDKEFPAGDTTSFGCAEGLLGHLIDMGPVTSSGSQSDDTVTCSGGGGRVRIRGWVETGAGLSPDDTLRCRREAMGVLHDRCYNRVGARVWRTDGENRRVCFIQYEKLL
ncbi:unnamed protein product [Linum trigynum]|uniref:Gnk2-homologous domain-containing protein n=1 Tax=Linum trigynum TaxID=586398 RepID=A0AAV2DX10_9ROSI